MTLVRSPGALALGALFALGTGYVLFHDVHHWREVTVDHVMTALVLVGTVASGHMLSTQLKAWRVLPSLGLAVLFLAGTFYCVTTSAARNADVTVTQRTAVHSVNEERARIKPQLERSEKMLAEARIDLARECKSGRGTRCKGVEATVMVYEAAVKGHQSDLAKLGPAQPEDAGVRHAAQVFAALPYVTAPADVIASQLLLFGPFVKALFLEVACIVFLGIGLGHGRPAQGIATPGLPRTRLVAQPAIRIPSQLALPAPRLQSGLGADMERAVLDALSRARRPLSNEELAGEVGVTPGAASKIRKRVERNLRLESGRGLCVERDGRQLAISLARH